MMMVGCGAIPTYSPIATLDIGQAIAQTAAVEFTRVAGENNANVTVEPDNNTEIRPTATAEPLSPILVETQRPKDIALLLGTLSMSPGSEVYAGEKFHVTWRIRNIGETIWNEHYSLVYIGGEAFGQAPALPLSVEVAPGEIIDLTLVLTAPVLSGNYRGEWLLVAPDGEGFGVGYEDPQPLAVDVVVGYHSVDLGDHELRLLFMDYSTAQWRDQHGPAFCSASGNIGVHGFVTRKNEAVFEGENEENEPTLILQPAQGEGGFIEGRFTPYHVTAGNYFTTYIGCLEEGKFCDVSIKIYVQVVGTSSIDLYWEGGQVNDGEWVRIHQPLEKYRDDDIIFIFRVENNGDATGDIVGWLGPMILH
jgi:hypothetical protein